MAEAPQACPACGRPTDARAVSCSVCSAKLHRECAKKYSGKYFCRQHRREGKKMTRYERMAQRDAVTRGAAGVQKKYYHW